MIAPSAMMIEAAKDQLADPDYREAHAWVWPSQAKSLASAAPQVSPEFAAGYELGLQTARVQLAGNPAAVAAKVSL